MVTFKKAQKDASYLRMALAGPSGSGKTYTALALASSLAGEKPVAVIDTERGSASKYSDLFEFDVLEPETFHPERYIEAIKAAQDGGYGVVVVDSLTHAWEGPGGLLEIVEQIAKRSYNGNTFRAWSEGTPIQNRLIDALTGARLHVIVTMRTKNDYAVDKDERSGRMTPRKVGLAVKQRDGIEYEFDIFGKMTMDNELIVEKTRCPALTGAIISKPGEPLAETLRGWLNSAPTPQRPHLVATTSTQETRDEDEAIYYEPEPAPEPAPEWNPMADVKFISSLRGIHIESVADKETFVAEAREHHPDETLREACRLEYATRFNAQKKGTTKAIRGNRGPSALGATLADGESAPDSLEGLHTGARAS